MHEMLEVTFQPFPGTVADGCILRCCRSVGMSPLNLCAVLNSWEAFQRAIDSIDLICNSKMPARGPVIHGYFLGIFHSHRQ